MNADGLNDVARAGVFQLVGDPRALARAAASAGLMVVYADIGHAHNKKDFLAQISKVMSFPEWFGGNWDALADCLKDLSWMQAKGWVVILEKSKHFCGGHGDEFKEAMEVMAEAAEYWRREGKPFWTLIGGPEGWKSGWPEIPSS